MRSASRIHTVGVTGPSPVSPTIRKGGFPRKIPNVSTGFLYFVQSAPPIRPWHRDSPHGCMMGIAAPSGKREPIRVVLGRNRQFVPTSMVFARGGKQPKVEGTLRTHSTPLMRCWARNSSTGGRSASVWTRSSSTTRRERRFRAVFASPANTARNEC